MKPNIKTKLKRKNLEYPFPRPPWFIFLPDIGKGSSWLHGQTISFSTGVVHYYSSTVSTALRTHLTGNLQVFNNNSYITEVTRRGYKALNVCSIQPPNSDQTAAARGAHNRTSKQSFVLILNHYYIKILKKKFQLKNDF